MVTAVILLTVQRDRIEQVAQTVAELRGVSEVYSVGGRYDLAAIVRVADNEKLAEMVTGHLLKVHDILSSETLIAFKVYSRHDLDAMFSVGLEEE